MMQAKEIQIESFNYNLPENKIAKYPLTDRSSSKLLVYNQGNIQTENFNDIIKYIPENSLLCYNNTKVVYARLFFEKQSGAKIEIFCLEPHLPHAYEEIFASRNTCRWKCIVGNLKKWKNGVLSKQTEISGKSIKIEAEQISRNGQDVIIQFNWDADFTFGEILESEGNIPIPPYLKRKSEDIDKIRYQTVYADVKGSVAAPTAGLHFNEEIFEELKTKGVCIDPVTLHVGAGTFQPVKSNTIGDHNMHTEFFSISAQTLINIKTHIGNITAVGTTTLRTLESIYQLALNIADNNMSFHINQWDNYKRDSDISPSTAIDILLEYMDKNKLKSLSASTEIIIVPGYKFRLTNRLITNFHQPRSTLLLLVAAFVGIKWTDIYDYALNKDFRFLSYGDSSILIP